MAERHEIKIAWEKQVFDTMFPNRNPFYTYDGLVAVAGQASTLNELGNLYDDGQLLELCTRRPL